MVHVDPHLFKGDLGCVHNIGPISLVVWVILIPENKGDVCRGAVEGLIPLPGEGDPGPGLPPFLHHNVQHLLLGSQAPAIRVEAAACDLHLLCAAVHHLFKGHRQVVYHGLARQAPRALPQASLITGEATQVGEGGLAEGVEEVVIGIRVTAEEDVEVVRVVEEGGEGGVGVVLEIVAENVSLAC